jgi:TRAP-type C4-dicarboxylate transport system substrate-binding protein
MPNNTLKGREKNMKKVIALGLASVMAMSLAACGGGSSSTTAAATTAAPAATQAAAEGEKKEEAAPAGGNIDKLNLKVSYATGDTGSDGMTAIEFERLVEEKSGGLIQVDRYPNCQLSGGDMQRHVEMMVAGGAFEIAIISETSFSVIDNDFYAQALLFGHPTLDDMYDQYDNRGYHEFIDSVFNKYNIKFLDVFPNGIQHLANNKRPVHTVADMKDLKMRAYGDTQMAMQRAMGADPVNMSFSELYSALQTGTVDGNTNGYMTMYSASFQEVQKYVTECGIICSPYDFLADLRVWNKWSPDTQALIQECATEASHYGRNFMDEQTEIAKQAFIDAGAEIYVPTEEELQTFKDAVQPVNDEIIANLSDECKKVLGL